MKISFRSKLVAAAVVLGGVFAVTGVQTAQAQAIQDCSTNSIIRCGAASPTDLVTKIKANNPADLQAIYSKFTLTPDKYDEFASEAKMGMAQRNGDIVVDGQVVARDAWSIGREKKSYSTTYTINGQTYHKSKATDVLKQDLPVMVWFDDQGKVAAAVLAACGNPMGGTQVTPSFSCKQLKSEQVEGQANTYRFSTEAPVTSNATVSRVVYNFGDGSPEETRTNPADVVTHTYTKSGTAKVTVYVKLPGGKEVVANGNGCAHKVTAVEKKEAAWKCTNLTATAKLTKEDEYIYTLRATSSTTNARLVRADFNFGDGNTQTGVAVANSTDNNIAVEHTYVDAGSYTAKATLHFEATDGATEGASNSITCEVNFTIDKPVVKATTTTTQELPKTGFAGAAGLFAGASVLGTLGYRWRARRRMTKIDDLVDRLRR